MKRLVLLLLCLSGFFTSQAFAQEMPSQELPPEQLELTDEGFLPADSDREEYIWQDEESGIWQYVTKSLYIRVTRRQDDTPLVWFETEVLASEQSPLKTYLPEGKTPGRKLVNPVAFSKEKQIVLAITDDFSGYRIQNGQKVGIVIRDGIVLGNKTRNSSRNRGWPNLDTLAVFQDGSMKANLCDAYTAQEYLDQGAKDVFAFGPIMITDGELSDEMKDEGYYPYREPRMAIGMIEPYHYLILTAVGRKDESEGTMMQWMAQKMLELGVQEAINLDGGGTAALMFMGKALNRSEKNMRSINSLIGFGQSQSVSGDTP